VRGSPAPLALLGLLLTTCLAGCSRGEADDASEAAPAPSRSPAAGEDDALYALGGWLARELAGVKFEEKDLKPIQEGLADALLRRPLRVEPRAVAQRVQKLLGDRRAATAAEEKLAAQAFLAEARQQPGARRTTNGVVYQSLADGRGEAPKLTDRVRVQYQGTLRDGSTFDSSYERGKPAVFGLDQVVPCWTEALQLMKPGGKARITCPSDLAYGDRGLPGRILPGAPLRFEIELLEILPASEAKAAPTAPETP
jgi:FKBP-type peptidyl-prolyl cis-trans isomerase